MPAEGSVPAVAAAAAVGSAMVEVAPPGTSGLAHGVVSAMVVASGPAPGVDSGTLAPTATVAAADGHPVPAVTAETRVAIATVAAATEGAAAAAAADGSVQGLRLAHVVATKETKPDNYKLAFKLIEFVFIRSA